MAHSRGSGQRPAEMTIATNNGVPIIRDGKVVTSCSCCGGACCNGTTCSVKPEDQCNAAAGEVFKGVGTVCSPNPCSECPCGPRPNIIYSRLLAFIDGDIGAVESYLASCPSRLRSDVDAFVSSSNRIYSLNKKTSNDGYSTSVPILTSPEPTNAFLDLSMTGSDCNAYTTTLSFNSTTAACPFFSNFNLVLTRGIRWTGNTGFGLQIPEDDCDFWTGLATRAFSGTGILEIVTSPLVFAQIGSVRFTIEHSVSPINPLP